MRVRRVALQLGPRRRAALRLAHLLARTNSPNAPEAEVARRRVAEHTLTLLEQGMPTLTSEEVAKLKTANPGLELHQLGDGAESIVVRLPSRAEWKRMKAMRLEGGAKAVEAYDWLVSTCLVWPTEEQAEELFNSRPAIVDSFANEIAELAGATEKVSAKKL